MSSLSYRYLRKRDVILINKVSGHERYLSAKGRFVQLSQRYWVDFQRKGARLGRYTPGILLPRKIMGRYQVAIDRDFVDYERIRAYFSTRNLYKEVNMATARRERPTRATMRVPMSFHFYRETTKSLQEILNGMRQQTGFGIIRFGMLEFVLNLNKKITLSRFL